MGAHPSSSRGSPPFPFVRRLVRASVDDSIAIPIAAHASIANTVEHGLLGRREGVRFTHWVVEKSRNPYPDRRFNTVCATFRSPGIVDRADSAYSRRS